MLYSMDKMRLTKWFRYMETYSFIVGFYPGISRDGQPGG